MSAVELDNVSYSYSSMADEPIVAVENVSLSIEEGEFVALVGHNGCGKSTLAKLLNGLLIPSEGEVKIFGQSTRDKKKLFEIRSNIGVVFQNPDNQMVATIVEDDLAFGPENLGVPSEQIRERVDWALQCVGMSEYATKSPFRLSGGQKQRIAIAGILAIRPQIMVLDESTAMLDPQGRREVIDVIKKLNRENKMTVIMITHYMEEAVGADKIIVMNNGRVELSGGKEVFYQVDKLRSIGLDVPPVVDTVMRLREKGIEIADIYTEQELIEALCQ